MNNYAKTIEVLEDGKLSVFLFSNKEVYIQPPIVVDSLDDNSICRVRGSEGNVVNCNTTIETIDGIAFSGTFEELETALREMANEANDFASGGGILSDFDIEQAIREIKALYGVDVSVIKKSKSLLRYGESEQVQITPTTLMELPTGTFEETYVFDNTIDTISSSNANDKQIIKVEGHTVGGDVSASSLTQTGGLATFVGATAHSSKTGDWVNISGAVETQYNGIVKITVIDNNTFTFAVDAAAGSPATGTIKANNQEKKFVVQTVQLDGTNKVPLITKLARVSDSGICIQDRATNNLGDIYIYEDDTTTTPGVPDTDSKVHLMIKAGTNQSKKASTSLSSKDYWIVTSIHSHMLEKSLSYGDVVFEKRLNGGVWREVDNVSTSASSSTNRLPFKPYVVIPANADTRLQATVDANNKKMGGTIQGYLAIVK